MFGILEGSLVDMLEKVGGDIFGLIGSMNGYTYIYWKFYCIGYNHDSNQGRMGTEIKKHN
ncbi:hypothetical protein [Bacillus cereus]|uniref:hypothetical protein n=1 Tax=Bacillus cereus TaxID=1396 RepID=UPI0007ABE268|nr:hypothetical protein [Bacillus cereus]KZD42297.1 hypothetical protein B4084_4945 [Bacillus cereus]